MVDRDGDKLTIRRAAAEGVILQLSVMNVMVAETESTLYTNTGIDDAYTGPGGS